MEPLKYIKPDSWKDGNQISFFNKDLEQYKKADSNLYTFDLIAEGLRITCKFLGNGYHNNRETLDFIITQALAAK